MKPLISILVPAFQAEKTIYRCLESIVRQASNNYEVIVIDDGSTDSTWSICQSFSWFPRLRIYSQKNVGVSATRQRLLSLAQGEYIQFVDADDWIEWNMVSELCDVLQAKSPDLVISDYILHIPGATRYQSQRPTSLTTSALIKDISSTDRLGVLWNKLIKKELFSNLIFPNLRYCEDWCVCVELFQKASAVFYNNRAYYHYDNTIIEGSLTRDISEDTFRSRLEYIGYLKEIRFDETFPHEYHSQVAGIAYTALVRGIYREKLFRDLFNSCLFMSSYIPMYKKLILWLSFYIGLSFARCVDTCMRKLLVR